LSKAVYCAIAHDAPPPWELVIWTLAERFGWTLEYIENLPMARMYDFFRIEDGRIRASRTARMKHG